MKNLVLLYNPDHGLVVKDGEVNDVAYSLYINAHPTEPTIVYIASEMIIMAIRVLIKQQIIDTQEITVMFRHKKMKFNKDARLSDWPRDFCDTYERMLLQL